MALTSVENALALLLSQARPVQETETVPLLECLGRVLAAPQYSEVNVPPLDNSAMDGYAVYLADIPQPGVRLPVSQRIPAGNVGEPLIAGTVARIFTGAPVPPGAEAVVMQEKTELAGDEVVINQIPEPGQNIRQAGEDIRAGTDILGEGRRLRAGEIGLLASVGIADVPVYRRLKVALFMTGDELVEPGQALKEGQIYNSNRYTLSAQLQSLGCEIIDSGIVADTMPATLEALQSAASQADLVISTGGVSVGEEDYVKKAIDQLGEVHLWNIAVKPGKPLAFGHVGGTPLLGLPGNPVSGFVTFAIFARPFIRKMQGMEPGEDAAFMVPAAFEWPKPGTRREFLRARLQREDSELKAIIYPHQGSGVLTSVAWADGLVDIPSGVAISAGDAVRYIPYTELDI